MGAMKSPTKTEKSKRYRKGASIAMAGGKSKRRNVSMAGGKSKKRKY